MNTKPTRMLFTAVALSALAAVLGSSAQARISVGNGTKPPSQMVVHEDALAELLANSAYERIPVGNGTKPPPGAVVREQQLLQQASVREKLGEIGAWAVPSISLQKPQLLQQTSVDEKLGEIGAWAVPVGLPQNVLPDPVQVEEVSYDRPAAGRQGASRG